MTLESLAMPGVEVPITLGQNISSLSARRYLDESTARFTSIAGRLSSGQRVTNPSDDPAAIAVASTLSTKSRVLGRAGRNIADGLSALQTAEGGLSSIQTLLSRMNELAAQAGNGSLSSIQRKSLDEEFQTLSEEIKRISRSTSFNKISLFAGRQSANAPVARTSSATLSPVGLSGDGKYAVTATAADGVRLQDLETGAITVIDAAAGAAQAVMASNGDVVYSKNSQLFHYSRSTGEINQITQSLGGDSYAGLTISADGTTVAFTTGTQYVNGGRISDGGALSGGLGIAILNLESGIVKVLDGSSYGGSDGLRLSNNGSKLIYYQDEGISGQGIFYVDETLLSPRRIATNSAAGFIPPIGGVTDDGRAYYAAFDDFVLMTGNLELIEYNADSNTNSLVKSTAYNGAQAYSISSITVGADNNTLQIVSGNNYTGENPNEYMQAFQFDLTSREFTQLTAFSGQIELAAGSNTIISGDGSRLTYVGAGNIAYSVDLAPDSSPLDIEAGFGSSGRVLATLPGIEGSVRGLGGFALTSRFGALGALDSTRNAIAQVGRILGGIGSFASRLEAAASVTSAQDLELQSARNRITDIDAARESAELLRSRINQDIGAAILAQANLQPQIALELLNIRN